jgi:hypothetical protein
MILVLSLFGIFVERSHELGIFFFFLKLKMADEDSVASFIDPNEVDKSINRFAIDEVVARINQNEVNGSIKKFTRNNFHIWKFQVMIIFRSKELLDIVEGTKMIEDVYDQRIWRKHDNEAMMLIINAIDEKVMASLLKCKTFATMWERLFIIHGEKNHIFL